MNTTKGNRLHIGFFGKRNVGKSSLVNKIIGQDISIVSDIAGTTTDVNQKSMELLPIGPVAFMDTAGFDDEGDLGVLRIEKTKKILARTDVAVFVVDSSPLSEFDFDFLNELKLKKIPVLLILNKVDTGILNDSCVEKLKKNSNGVLKISAKYDLDITEKFKKALINILPDDFINRRRIIPDFINKGDAVVLVIPIDKEAPKGRLILPQVNVIRDLLDCGGVSVVCGIDELSDTIGNLKTPPKLVITDSQAFKQVAAIVPKDIMLTSFSILFAQLKGDLNTLVNGAAKIDELQDGNKVLILESCTHHPVEDDIGRVKIPGLIKKYTGKELVFEHYSGHDFPSDISGYSLVVHCGACMTNRREMLNRIDISLKNSVPITNYGIAISKCLGILDRAIKPLIQVI